MAHEKMWLADHSQTVLRQIMDLVPHMIFAKDRQGRLILLNNAVAEAYGDTVEHILGASQREIHDSRDEVEHMLSDDLEVIESGRPKFIPEEEFTDSAGNVRILQTTKVPFTVPGTDEQAMLGVAVDITDLTYSERLHQQRSKALQELASNAPIERVLERIVSSAQETNPGLIGSILLLDDAGQRLKHTAAPNLPDFYNEAINGLEIGPDVGSCGAAAFLGKRVVVDDIMKHPNWADYRKLAAKADLRASWSEPIFGSNGEVLGTFALYYRVPRTPSLGELELIKDSAHLAGIAIERRRAENALHDALDEIAKLRDMLQAENVYLRKEIDRSHNIGEIIGESDALARMLEQVDQVAVTDATVLLHGETGTGKELLANAIHSRSDRRLRPMVTVNCAALPASLIEGELFGHEKGAYTGAHDKQIGRFELANGSTLFLDEIGDFPLELQGKLLRVLQDGAFERLGQSRSISVDVRVVAATNRDLAEEVKNGNFRADLFHRLNVFPIRVAPLRERREDIPLLVLHLIAKYARKFNKEIDVVPQTTIRAMVAYDWPGNIRELENVIERAVILTKSRTLQVDNQFHNESPITNDGDGKVKLLDVQREHILRVLEETRWRIEGKNGAAVTLGVNPATLRSRLKRLGIRRPA